MQYKDSEEGTHNCYGHLDFRDTSNKLLKEKNPKLNKFLWCKYLQNKITHPDDPELKFLIVLPIDTVKNKAKLLEKEVWWQENVSVHKVGLNKWNDLATVRRRRRMK